MPLSDAPVDGTTHVHTIPVPAGSVVEDGRRVVLVNTALPLGFEGQQARTGSVVGYDVATGR
jgi:hypothetical protein